MDSKLKIEIVDGVGGFSLYVNGTRVAGPKPLGGGRLVKAFEVKADSILSLLAPVLEKAEKYKKALEQIERGCSFPEDDVQRAIRDVARKTLFEVPDGN